VQENKIELSYSPEALAEIQNIWDYSERMWSTTRAEVYVRRIYAAIDKIAQYPRYGRHYEGVPIEYLAYKAGRHIIFYRIISPDEIKIVRILHESMSFKKQFAGRRSLRS
jgi:toxin ParE1/3/4